VFLKFKRGIRLEEVDGWGASNAKSD
jgi:hypothetical protein